VYAPALQEHLEPAYQQGFGQAQFAMLAHCFVASRQVDRDGVYPGLAQQVNDRPAHTCCVHPPLKRHLALLQALLDRRQAFGHGGVTGAQGQTLQMANDVVKHTAPFAFLACALVCVFFFAALLHLGYANGGEVLPLAQVYADLHYSFHVSTPSFVAAIISV
jgi:hypothetical protein